MASIAIAAANITNFVGEVWSTKIKAAAENKLVFVKLCDRRYEADLKRGDTINVPNLASFSANAVNTDADMTLYDTVQNVDQIIVNYWYEAGVGFSDMHKVQAVPSTMEAFASKCAYAIAKQKDTSVNALVNTLSQTGGTEGSALTADILIGAYETLNEADAPEDDRAWVFDPESITDLLGIDMFIRTDYVPEGVMSKGFTGRSIFGAPVYMTNNLEAINTTYHGAAYLHKECFALVEQPAPKVDSFYWPERYTTVVRATDLWGVLAIRGTYGYWIKTRS